MHYWNTIYSIVKKDITVEMRAKEAVIAMLVFGLMVIVIFSIAFALALDQQLLIAPGLLWVAFIFAGILGLNHTFSSEQENSSIQGIMLAPVPKSALYVGKLISNTIFMLVSEAIVLLIFLWFFDVRFTDKWLHLAFVITLGTTAFASTGTLFAALSSGLRMRVFLLPILQFPIAVPAIIFAVEATGSLLVEDQLIGYFDWVRMLIVFNVVFISASVMLFEYILEE